jgi:hypothetical protein
MAFHITAESPLEFPNEPLMYPVRLKINTNPNKFVMYAYPSQRPTQSLVQLETKIPPIVEYVLGPTWREHLTGLGVMTMPQFNWSNAGEIAVVCVS